MLLTLMLKEVSGEELSHGASGLSGPSFCLQVEHLIVRTWLLSVPPRHTMPPSMS